MTVDSIDISCTFDGGVGIDPGLAPPTGDLVVAPGGERPLVDPEREATAAD